MMTRSLNIVCTGILLAVTPALTQDIERPVQMGVKMTEPNAAVATQVSIRLDDMARSAELFEGAVGDLTSLAAAEGFTIIGPIHIVTQGMGQPVDGKMAFELRLLIAEQPTQEDLATDYGFTVVMAPSQKVAYTFHKGSLDQSQGTVMGLIQSTMQNGMQMTGGPQFVICPMGADEEPQVAEIRVPVK